MTVVFRHRYSHIPFPEQISILPRVIIIIMIENPYYHCKFVRQYQRYIIKRVNYDSVSTIKHQSSM